MDWPCIITIRLPLACSSSPFIKRDIAKKGMLQSQYCNINSMAITSTIHVCETEVAISLPCLFRLVSSNTGRVWFSAGTAKDGNALED